MKEKVKGLCVISQFKKQSTHWIIPFLWNARKCQLMYGDWKEITVGWRRGGRKAGLQRDMRKLWEGNRCFASWLWWWFCGCIKSNLSGYCLLYLNYTSMIVISTHECIYYLKGTRIKEGLLLLYVATEWCWTRTIKQKYQETNSVPIEGNISCPSGPTRVTSGTLRSSSLGLLQHKLKVHLGGTNDIFFEIPNIDSWMKWPLMFLASKIPLF